MIVVRAVKISLILIFVVIISYCFYFFLFTTLQAEGELYLPQNDRLYDLVLKHALIWDGTGEKAAFRGDLAIKNGLLVKVGSVQEADCPVFDAGGLTVMPQPLSLLDLTEKDKEGLIEHLLETGYPRYPASALYLQKEPYLGFSLAQIAQQRGQTVLATQRQLQGELPQKSKVYLLPGVLNEAEPSLAELVASLTGYVAQALGKTKQGLLKLGYAADLYFFITDHYDEANLRQLFLKGELPACALFCRAGELIEPEK